MPPTLQEKHTVLLALLMVTHLDTVVQCVAKMKSILQSMILKNPKITEDFFRKVLKKFEDMLYSTHVFDVKRQCKCVLETLEKIPADNRTLVLKWGVSMHSLATNALFTSFSSNEVLCFDQTCFIFDAFCDWTGDGCNEHNEKLDGNRSRFGFTACVAQCTLGIPSVLMVMPFELLSSKEVAFVLEVIGPWNSKAGPVTALAHLNLREVSPFIMDEYLPTLSKYLSSVQKHYTNFKEVLVFILQNVWKVTNPDLTAKSIFTLDYKDVLLTPLTSMYEHLVNVVPIYMIWKPLLKKRFEDMCPMKACCLCTTCVDVGIPLTGYYLICIRCFENISTEGVDSDSLFLKLIDVLSSVAPLGPPLGTLPACAATHHRALVSTTPPKHTYGSFVEMCIYAKNHDISLNFTDNHIQAVKCGVVNIDQTTKYATVDSLDTLLVPTDMQTCAVFLSDLFISNTFVSVTVVFVTSADPVHPLRNAWAHNLGMAYKCMSTRGQYAVGPAYIMQERKRGGKCGQLLNIAHDVFDAAVRHSVGALDKSKYDWRLVRPGKKKSVWCIERAET